MDFWSSNDALDLNLEPAEAVQEMNRDDNNNNYKEEEGSDSEPEGKQLWFPYERRNLRRRSNRTRFPKRVKKAKNSEIRDGLQCCFGHQVI